MEPPVAGGYHRRVVIQKDALSQEQAATLPDAGYNSFMHIVAITALSGPIEKEAAALAFDLESAAYDERLNLNAGFPAVVLATPDEERAEALLLQLRKRGQAAIGCDGGTVVPGDKMISLRRFGLNERAVLATDRPGFELPFAEIAVMVRATLVQTRETHAVVKEKKFDVGRAIATGGLMMSKTTVREVTSVKSETDDVLYLFRRDREPPWILRASLTHYPALGADLGPVARTNFLTLVALLRKRAPRAAYDERLLAMRFVPERARRAAAATPSLASSPDGGNDLLAHLIAASLPH